MGEAHFDKHIGRDAMRVWFDFWELTGSMRVDIVRKSYTDGDPSMMIPPDVDTKPTPSVPAVLLEGNVESTPDRSGDLVSRTIKLELIDTVHDTDTIVVGGYEYRIDRVLKKDLGDFSVWIVQAHR
jgi:hypothetical protein